MQRLKKVNLLFCLVFSFIFLFGSVFSVQAEDFTHKSQSLKLPLGSGACAAEIVRCVVDYTTQNDGEKKIIRSIDKTEFSAWDPFDEYIYEFEHAYEISKNGDSALIHVTVIRTLKSTQYKEKFNLTFELKDFERENRSLVLPLGPGGFSDEIVKCVVDYKTQNIGEYAEKKIIRSIDKTSFSARDMFDECVYKFGNIHTEISEDRCSALIHVTVTRILCDTGYEKEFDLTFELKVN